jgi:hypothetical protein
MLKQKGATKNQQAVVETEILSNLDLYHNERKVSTIPREWRI